MKQKPIELMRCYYGNSDGKICGTCCNLREYRYNSKRVRKCIAYGGLHSSKADWAKRWPACGLHGKVVPGQLVSDTAKAMFGRIGVAQSEPNCDGQMTMGTASVVCVCGGKYGCDAATSENGHEMVP